MVHWKGRLNMLVFWYSLLFVYALQHNNTADFLCNTFIMYINSMSLTWGASKTKPKHSPKLYHFVREHQTDFLTAIIFSKLMRFIKNSIVKLKS